MSSFAQRELVPQGIVLGPRHCYSICMLPTCIILQLDTRYKVSLPAFADDMSLYSVFTTQCSRKAMDFACSEVSKALTSISSELESRVAHSQLREDSYNGYPSRMV